MASQGVKSHQDGLYHIRYSQSSRGPPSRLHCRLLTVQEVRNIVNLTCKTARSQPFAFVNGYKQWNARTMYNDPAALAAIMQSNFLARVHPARVCHGKCFYKKTRTQPRWPLKRLPPSSQAHNEVIKCRRSAVPDRMPVGVSIFCLGAHPGTCDRQMQIR